MLKNILVPLDGSKYSKKALQTAILISGKNTTITAFHVIRFPAMCDATIKKRYKNMASKIMRDAAKTVKKSGLAFRWKIKQNGHPAKEIVRLAQNGFDAIVMGSRGPDPSAEIFIGSVANYVLNKAKVPVMIVK